MKFSYPAIFIKSEDSDCYNVIFPKLIGACTFGDDFEDAVNMAEDALKYMAEINYDDCLYKEKPTNQEINNWYKDGIIKEICVEYDENFIKNMENYASTDDGQVVDIIESQMECLKNFDYKDSMKIKSYIDTAIKFSNILIEKNQSLKAVKLLKSVKDKTKDCFISFDYTERYIYQQKLEIKLAQILFSLKDYENAKSAFEKVVRNVKGNPCTNPDLYGKNVLLILPYAYLNLAKIYENLKDYQNANINLNLSLESLQDLNVSTKEYFDMFKEVCKMIEKNKKNV